jgi:hypothetical protein
MRKNEIIYDFDNLIDIIKCSRNNLSVIPIDSSDIYLFSDNFSYIFTNKSKKKKLFNMSDIKSIQFRKGSANAFVKCNYLEDNYKEVNILKRKVYKTLRNHINELKMGRNSSLISSSPKNIKPVGISQNKKVL